MNILKDFYLALQGTTQSFNYFLEAFSSLKDAVHSHPETFEEHTLRALQTSANIIQNGTSDLLKIYDNTEKICEEVQADATKLIDEEMANLRISDPTSTQAPISSPGYVKEAFEWLLLNLHNPYPSRDIKKAICREKGCSIKDLEAWFVDVRKRIGWNALRKTRFSNKQEKIIAAAAKVFLPEPVTFADDLNTHLISEVDPHDMYRADFLAIEKRAKLLYADKFPGLVLPSYKNTMVCKSTTPLPQISHTFDAAYPTPEPSPPSYSDVQSQPQSPLPASTDCSAPLSRKRQRPSFDTSEEEPPETCNRANKRMRSFTNETDDLDASQVLSPPLNTTNPDDLSDNCSYPDTTLTPYPEAPNLPTLKRKRRLSDGELQRPAKRPHNALCLPRLQAVSNPLPSCGSTFQDTVGGDGTSADFATHLTESFPFPANVEDPSSSDVNTSLDIQIYDFSPYNPEASLPEVLAGVFPSVEVSDPFSFCDSFESSSLVDPFHDDSISFFTTTNPEVGSTPPPLYQYDFPRDQITPSDNLITFPDSNILLSVPGYIPESTSLLDDVYNNMDTHGPLLGHISVLQDSNHQASGRIHGSIEQEAKRARANALREELALYEAEGL